VLKTEYMMSWYDPENVDLSTLSNTRVGGTFTTIIAQKQKVIHSAGNNYLPKIK